MAGLLLPLPAPSSWCTDFMLDGCLGGLSPPPEPPDRRPLRLPAAGVTSCWVDFEDEPFPFIIVLASCCF
jgi:hypothetical protein